MRKKGQEGLSRLCYDWARMVQTQDIYRLLGGVISAPERDQSLDALSGRSGRSKFHLHRRFRQAMGETPKQYVLRLRLERAAALLTTTRDHVLTIALRTGFDSHEVFTRAFKRAYGRTPTQYRAAALAPATEQMRTQHQEFVRQVGPCIRQFRVSDNKASGRQFMPFSTITRKDVKAQPLLFIRRSVAYTDLKSLYEECFPKVFGYAMKSGLAIAGQPLARYVSTGTGLWTIDCAIPMAEASPGEGEIEAGVLQAGPAAFAVHSGSYDELPQTNAAIQKWIEENGLKPGGPPWEVYATDPAEYPDIADWKTEVYWPLEK